MNPPTSVHPLPQNHPLRNQPPRNQPIHEQTHRKEATFSRPQRLTVVYGIIGFVLVLLVCQIWLVTSTVHAYLGGDHSVVWPAAIASLFCLGLNVGLLRYIYQMERA